MKVAGQRAYRLARAGRAVELPEREVEVYRFEQTWHQEDRRGFVIECSAGTYVRSLIAGLGDAYCLELRRTRIGHLAVADADPARIIPLDRALEFLPEVRLDVEQVALVAHGRAIAGVASGVVRLNGEEGLIALGDGDGRRVRPVVVLKPAR